MGLGSDQDARGVLTLTFDDPRTRNALSLDVLSNLLDRLYLVGGDCRVVVLTGAGTTFSSGADRGEIADPANIERAGKLVLDLLARLDSLEVPVVARVNGAAFGSGLALVAAADIAVAADGARFGFPEVRFGMVAEPAIAACRRRVPEGALLDLFLSGRQFDTAEAASFGLVAHTAPPELLDGAVESVVADLLIGDRAAIAATRRLIRGGLIRG